MVFALFFISFPKIKVPPPSGKSQKISLNLSDFSTPPAAKPVVLPPQPKALPPIPKPVPIPLPEPIVKKSEEETLKPINVVKKKLAKDETRTFVEKIESKEQNTTKAMPKKVEKKKLTKKEPKKVEIKKQKNKKKTVKKKTVKKRVLKKRIVKKQSVKRKPQRKRSKNPLANALMGSGSSMYPSRPASSGSYSANMINKLYGREFNGYTSTQKKFIKNNLGTIHRITQRTLTRNGYPEVAIRTRQQGTNVVSFYLHPNGDISKLRLKTRIGYQALDKNTLEVIRIAYKDYPLPNQKTKIIFYVQYSIY